MRVLVFGDSITQGLWDTEGGWVDRLRKHYDTEVVKDLKQESGYLRIFNLGVSGNTTQDILKRLEHEADARTWRDGKFFFILSIGTNNAIVEEEGKLRSTPEDYRKDLEKIVDIVRDYSDKILFVGIPPCDQKLTDPVFWADIHYTNDRLFEFEQVLRVFCAEQQIPHVPTFETFQEKLKTGHGLFADGLHPNNEGHELIFQLVRPELDKLLSS